MDYQIPPLLFAIPALSVDERHYDAKGRLQLSLDDAVKLRTAYFRDVAAYLRSSACSVEDDITPAVECALRLFNAENYTGELSPAETEHFREVYRRFGAPRVQERAPEKTPGTDGGSVGVGATTTTGGGGGGDRDSGDRDSDEEAASGLAKSAFVHAKDAYLQRLLTSDGEMANPSVRLAGLLLCVLAIMAARDGEGVPLFSPTNPWRLRAHMRHQLCLLHRAHSVFLEISACIDAVMAQPDERISVQTLLEVGQAQGYYHHRELAAETFRRAMRKSGLRVTEDAIRGVRTRWQTTPLVQMVLNAQSTRPVPEASMSEEQPVTVMSEKDGHDLFDRPRESKDAAALSVTPLHPEDKAVVLALCTDIHNNNPYHGLTKHHIQTYVERLVADPAPSPFMIRCQTLLVRSRLEFHRNRVQERAFLQHAELVEQYSARRDPSHARFARTKSDYFYAVAYPAVWDLKTEHGDLCFEETLYKTALAMYEQVLNWEKIIECCKKLDRRRRAESLAREMLEQDPSNPMLWVALGEATHEDAHLWKAWELCNHTMAAPMRALARLALDREHYAKVVQYFDEAVRLNPVFGGDWFALGYASLKLQLWGRSGAAFTRVCQIDPNDAFAWNNVASIMLRQKRLRPAFNAMSQALRNNRRDWRMWQNYFRIGCELREVSETTNALRIALTIAKRSIRLDRETMDLYVDNIIAYLKGEIPGSSADVKDNAAVHASDGVSYRSMAAPVKPDGDNAASEETILAERIEHVPVEVSLSDGDGEGEEEGSESAGLATLVPLGADEDLSRDEVYAASGLTGLRDSGSAPTANAATQEAIRRRHGERVRQLFLELTGTFVSDPDLYSGAARFFGFLDGPLAAYNYRVKELRACRQKDQWERDTALFTRTVECLQNMAKDATAAFVAAQEAQERSQRGATAANATAASSSAVSPSTPALLNPDDVVSSLKETQNNVKAALEASSEHMDGTTVYETLRSLAKSIRATLQEAKAAFV